MAAASRETRLFTLRMWQHETGDGQLEWRGKVQALPQGEVYYFRSWAGLVERLVAMLMSETVIPSFSLEEAQNDPDPVQRDD